jgi:hypothetical protein
VSIPFKTPTAVLLINLLKTALFEDPDRTAQETLFISVMKAYHLMLYREIIAVCYEINIKHVKILCGQIV